jgi:hypothetical protein
MNFFTIPQANGILVIDAAALASVGGGVASSELAFLAQQKFSVANMQLVDVSNDGPFWPPKK